MNCADFRTDLSSFADDALEAERALEMRRHLQECPACDWEMNRLRQMRVLLRTAGRVPPPPHLALALRVRLSQQRNVRLIDRLWVRVENLLAPVAVPAFAGIAAAILLFGILIHTFAIPTPAMTDDIPLALKTPPRLKLMMFEPQGLHAGEAGIFVEARVNEEGRIVDFRILRGPHDPSDVAKLRRALLFTTFDPASTFGVPQPGTLVLGFSSVSVKG